MTDMEVDESKNFKLLEALKKHDVDAVRELLQQGADIPDEMYDDAVEDEKNPFEVFMGEWLNVEKNIEEKRKEIINLFLRRRKDLNLAEYVIRSKDIHFAKEHVTYIIDHYNEDGEEMNLLVEIFRGLCQRPTHESLELEILGLLLDRGLPMNEFIEDSSYMTDRDLNTLLHCCIWENSFPFVRKFFIFISQYKLN